MQMIANQTDGGVRVDRAFEACYESLRRWALKITSNDAALAEDLVHEVYVSLREQNVVLTDLKNVEAYFHVAVRNAYRSKLRRDARFKMELIDDGLVTEDPRQIIKIRDSLFAVLRYACRRKSRSILGSILLLRYFHGYYIDEIALLLQRNRNAIDVRLVGFEREFADFREDASGSVADSSKSGLETAYSGAGDEDFIFWIRQQIFGFGDGDCLSFEAYRISYATRPTPVHRRLAAHFVSCRDCLELVNKIVGLPPLDQRDPLETLRRRGRSVKGKATLSLAAGASPGRSRS